MKRRLFGVVGKMGAGKDTAFGAFPGAIRLGFSDPLKRICREVFDLSIGQVETQEGKASLLKSGPIAIDDHLSDLSVAVGFLVQPRGLVAETPRHILQFVGTEYVRSVRPDAWIDLWEESLNRLPSDALVYAPDTRFLNEAARIRRCGGRLVRVTRLGLDYSGVPGHASEEEQDRICTDHHLYNGGTVAELQGSARFLVHSLA